MDSRTVERVLVVANAYPDERRPYYGAYVESDVTALRGLGLEVDVLYVPGYRGRREYARGAARVLARNRHRRPDVVHAWHGLAGALARLHFGAPLVVTFVGADILGEQPAGCRPPARALALRRLALLADATITRTAEMERVLPARRRHRNHVIPAGVDLSRFGRLTRAEARAQLHWDPERPIVLFPADPARAVKNFPLARAAFDVLCEAVPGCRLEVAATLPPALMPAAMAAADAVLLTSHVEGSPNVVKEAMAAEAPVVSTAVGDVPSLLAGVPACRVRPADPRLLAEALVEALREGRAAGARDAVAHLARERAARRIVGVYEEVLARRRTRRPGARPAAAPVPLPPPPELRGRRALVTGATGFIGRHLAERLVRAGADVRVLVRDPSRLPPAVAEAASVVTGDLQDPAAVSAALEGAELVFHCAAVTTNNTRWIDHATTNVEGTRRLLQAAERAGVRRLVHVSSIVVYGVDPPPDGSPIDEGTPYGDDGDRWAYYLRSKLAADRLATQGAGRAAMEVTVVRPGVVYGPGHAGPLTKGLLRAGPLRLTIGRARNVVPFVYVDDVVDGLLLAATALQAAGEAYNLVDDAQTDARTAARRADALSGDRVVCVPVPRPALDLVAALLERRYVRAGAAVPPKLSRFQVAQQVRDVRYDTAKARRELGWRPAVGFDEGVRRAVAAG